MIEIGIAIDGMVVARKLLRNAHTTSTTRHTAIIRVCWTSEIDSLIKVEES